MDLLYIGRYQFKRVGNEYYSLPAYADFFWEKYLSVFDHITVLGEEIKGYLDSGILSKIQDKRIEIRILPANTKPTDFKNDAAIQKILREYISRFQAILIKPVNRKGLMAINICDALDKKYIIELTGDLRLTLSRSKNILKRLYSPYLHRKILKSIKSCAFGLYVTQEYLQKVYPISGEMCGCTDTIIPDPNIQSLERRLSVISHYEFNHVYKIGMVATYHDNRKGLDTAIRACGLVEYPAVELHVLGIGTSEDREKWLNYADRYKMRSKLFFDNPVSSIDGVLSWNDQMDIVILPSRSEGLPRCIVESISRAVPCIISNVCGMPELVDTEWLHNPEDAKTLANKLQVMIFNPEEMIAAAKHNFLRSLNYRTDILAKKRDAFFKKYVTYLTGRSF